MGKLIGWGQWFLIRDCLDSFLDESTNHVTNGAIVTGGYGLKTVGKEGIVADLQNITQGIGVGLVKRAQGIVGQAAQ